jgi:hypothetical protein
MAPEATRSMARSCCHSRYDDFIVAGGCSASIIIPGNEQQQYLDGLFEGGLIALILAVPCVAYLAGFAGMA